MHNFLCPSKSDIIFFWHSGGGVHYLLCSSKSGIGIFCHSGVYAQGGTSFFMFFQIRHQKFLPGVSLGVHHFLLNFWSLFVSKATTFRWIRLATLSVILYRRLTPPFLFYLFYFIFFFCNLWQEIRKNRFLLFGLNGLKGFEKVDLDLFSINNFFHLHISLGASEQPRSHFHQTARLVLTSHMISSHNGE